MGSGLSIKYSKKMNPISNHNICKDYEEYDSDTKISDTIYSMVVP